MAKKNITPAIKTKRLINKASVISKELKCLLIERLHGASIESLGQLVFIIEWISYLKKNYSQIHTFITKEVEFYPLFEKILSNEPTKTTFTSDTTSTLHSLAIHIVSIINKSAPITLIYQESLLFLLQYFIKAHEHPIKRRVDILPRAYRKIVKKHYISQDVLDKLAFSMQSKRKAKKRTRILLKRLGIYTKKKPPFIKAT